MTLEDFFKVDEYWKQELARRKAVDEEARRKALKVRRERVQKKSVAPVTPQFPVVITPHEGFHVEDIGDKWLLNNVCVPEGVLKGLWVVGWG